MFENVKMTHDEGILWLLKVRKQIAKKKITDLFIASLSTRRLDWRSGLSAYAMARHFPDHKLDNKEDWGNYCKICGDHSYDLHQERELNLYNYRRFSTGGYESMKTSPDALAFYLDQMIKLEHVKPNGTDRKIWTNILRILLSTKELNSAPDLEKSLAQIKEFKPGKEERRAFLETLSLCGIIETKDHKGFYESFIPQIKREKRPHGASRNNWCYPIIWWKGPDGINKTALKFWFGEY